jgi:probable F420-dependent oxidoreductase
MRPPTLSVTLTNYGNLFREPGDWHRVLDLARMAEAAGVDRILLTDHVVMGEHTDAYPWGPFPFPPEMPWLEPLTMISAMSAVTERLRFSTKILIAPLRPAPLLAKTLATMDVLSRGRMEIGVSTGWQKEEYDASGVDWTRRGRLLTDTMEACRVLWSEAPASFESENVNFDRVWCSPKPLQEGGVPIWFAGSLHPRNIDRICRLGVGWIPAPYAPIDTFSEDVPRLREAWQHAGRDPEALQIQGDLDAIRDADGRGDLARSLEAVPDWIEAGATTVNVVMSLFNGWRGAPRFFEILEDRWPAFVTGDGAKARSRTEC